MLTFKKLEVVNLLVVFVYEMIQTINRKNHQLINSLLLVL